VKSEPVVSEYAVSSVSKIGARSLSLAIAFAQRLIDIRARVMVENQDDHHAPLVGGVAVNTVES
jgi:hypothetical protein